MSQENTQGNDARKYGFAGRLASMFIDSRLTPIVIIASILMGLFSVMMLPREEEPQIKVPMVDVMVRMPGASAKEVERRVTAPMEKLLWEVPGVEYVYSTSMTGASMVIVRFEVGSDLEDSLIKLNQKLQTNFDRIPHGVSMPLIKPHTIDDVPIMALTLHGESYDHYTLRRVATALEDQIKRIDEVAETRVIGGTRRQVRVELDPARLSSRGLSPMELIPALKESNQQAFPGLLTAQDQTVLVHTGRFFKDAGEVGDTVVGVYAGKPVFLREVADIVDGPEEPQDYVLFGDADSVEPAVTISVAKRPGANAVWVVDSIREKVAELEGSLIPNDMTVTVTRDYGETAAEKSNELLLHMGIAVFGVALLILFFLGWRESIVVLLAIPSTLALTLLVFYLYGYTLNRITLFALIFSIGILVDDAIVVVENIVRHVRLPGASKKPLVQVALDAVDEVGNPTVLATWAVIAAILPMAFVGGLMGPYMRPIPVGASAAMVFSLLIAFSITPWAAMKVLKRRFVCEEGLSEAERSALELEHAPDDWFTRLYHKIMDPLLAHASWRWIFLGSIILLLLGSMSLVGIGWVKVKMLPFDNKSEFQVIINSPEGTSLETTAAVAREIAEAIKVEPEVDNYQVYAGAASPFNFNGLVRHYFARSGPYVADVQVNLLPKHHRKAQSHDIAKRIRPRVAEIAREHGVAAAVAEVPPGPPVLQTIVAEIYGPDEASRLALATRVREILEATPDVVDVDWYVEDLQRKDHFVIDEEKAAINGITTGTISRMLSMAVSGMSVDLLHQPEEEEDVNIVLEFPRALRSHAEDLLNIELRSERDPSAPLVALRELVSIEEGESERSIYHKNLKPVVYVTADVSGATESPAYALFEINKEIAKLKASDFGGSGDGIKLFHLNQPFSENEPSIKWDGEWHITLEVFRDLGLAFAIVLILIYMLMVGWFKDYITPLVVMAAIPFSLIGILPAHGMFGAFFTATSMIGFMAGAGIVVRNSIILVDFIELRMEHGLKLAEAVVEAGAIRFRPMLLTALAVVVGAGVILADPIFQGLAISLMFGEIASLLISRMAVPVIYYMVNRKNHP
ncbi:MAG: efflux RND transporter permease subunit [Opitutales bacterium]|nr:efflux RND transporter permease subunit [Opitutales bacterium]